MVSDDFIRSKFFAFCADTPYLNQRQAAELRHDKGMVAEESCDSAPAFTAMSLIHFLHRSPNDCLFANAAIGSGESEIAQPAESSVYPCCLPCRWRFGVCQPGLVSMSRG